MGVTGVEGASSSGVAPSRGEMLTRCGRSGVFRKAAEITLKILRGNKDSLMSVLETFQHDPLVEWNKKVRTPTLAARRNGH